MIQIAHIETPFHDKFGVPRQAGLVDYEARVVFEPGYRVAEAFRGLEDFDYVWLLWKFHLISSEVGSRRSESVTSALRPPTSDLTWTPTVRPPRLGGNKRVGVFATRSPFRPNPIGLSCVRLLRVEQDAQLGPVLYVQGADLVDGTPIFDIKPYLAYADAHPDARSGFATEAPSATLTLDDPDCLLAALPDNQRKALEQTLCLNPTPHYQHDPQRLYALRFDRWEVRFRIDGFVLTILTVK